ncbi:MAG TPA: hypothetical protein VNS22_04585 [Geminicoccus sp.]|uniref:hypothetical protein n=1 Tax=Geminicoccus sp. TaxID=2024832 RepID=UPI002CE6A9D9|nr:hypothetical protein [Geminicoccus sp.]HWL67643.1 hypothetical protein [Geminicoccus sp.]
MSRFSFSALTAAAIALAAPAMAATQGELGDDSSGTSALSVTIPEQVQITGIGDITLDDLDAADLASPTGVFATDDVCVFSNAGESRSYGVVATGSGEAGAFTLVNGDETLAYEVKFNSSPGGNGTKLDPDDEPVAFAGGKESLDPGCGNANASFQVDFTPTALQAATAGQYGGTLTFLVSPLTP